MRWKPFQLQGTIYDLSHLNPRTHQYRQAAKGDKPERLYTVEIIFSLHCFTRRCADGEMPGRRLDYSDDRETRQFDFQRYELSRRLPAIVEGLQQRRCYHTGKGNFFSVEIINEDQTVTEYDIFFAASRSTRKGVINLFVQSAYVRDDEHNSNRPHRKPISFDVILFNTLNNKPITIPK